MSMEDGALVIVLACPVCKKSVYEESVDAMDLQAMNLEVDVPFATVLKSLPAVAFQYVMGEASQVRVS